MPIRGAKAKAAKGKGGKSAGKIIQAVETDAKKVNIPFIIWAMKKNQHLPCVRADVNTLSMFYDDITGCTVYKMNLYIVVKFKYLLTFKNIYLHFVS